MLQSKISQQCQNDTLPLIGTKNRHRWTSLSPVDFDSFLPRMDEFRERRQID